MEDEKIKKLIFLLDCFSISYLISLYFILVEFHIMGNIFVLAEQEYGIRDRP